MTAEQMFSIANVIALAGENRKIGDSEQFRSFETLIAHCPQIPVPEFQLLTVPELVPANSSPNS